MAGPRSISLTKQFATLRRKDRSLKSVAGQALMYSRTFGIIYCAHRRGARVVEWDGLENRCGARPHRGFESHPLRQVR